MQKLTFHRFLEKYVRSLSCGNTNSINKLFKEFLENRHLKEPLFLYAYSKNKEDLLLNASMGYAVSIEFTRIINEYSWDELVELLEHGDTRLRHGYRKVYQDYVDSYNVPFIDNNIRYLLHEKTRKLQESKRISNYMVYTDLKLNPSNVNAYLKHGDITRVKRDTAEKIIEYLEAE